MNNCMPINLKLNDIDKVLKDTIKINRIYEQFHIYKLNWILNYKPP